MKKFLLFLVLILSSTSGSAQFLGKIVYTDISNPSDQMEVWISAEKIRFRAKEIRLGQMKDMGINTSELFYDPVGKKLTMLMPEEKTALEVEILTLQEFMKMAQNLSGKPAPEPKQVPKATVRKTKLTRKISGYETFKLEIKPEGKPETVDLWVSESLKYEWSRVMDVLALAGYDADPSVAGWLAQNYLPLRLDFRKGETVKSFEAVSVSRTVKVSDFALPAGYTAMTLQQYMQAMMMKSMMGN